MSTINKSREGQTKMQLTTITLEASSKIIGIGGISVIWATCKDQYNSPMTCPTLIWSISDPVIANLESNLVTVSCFVTGKSNGSVNIIASTDSVKSDTIIITVTGPLLQSIEINPKNVDINIGKTLFFGATCKDQYNSPMICPTLVWESSNPLVGTIDQTGKLTGLSEGTTKITAFAVGKTSDITLVTVSPVKFGEFMIFGGLVIGITYMILRKPKV